MVKRHSFWITHDGTLLKCPVPDCIHQATLITKAHCKVAHGLTREEIEKRYGKPTIIKRKRVNYDT